MYATMPALLCFVARAPSCALGIVCKQLSYSPRAFQCFKQAEATRSEWGGCRLSITTNSPFVPRDLVQEAVDQAASSLPVSLSWQQLSFS